MSKHIKALIRCYLLFCYYIFSGYEQESFFSLCFVLKSNHVFGIYESKRLYLDF